MLGKPGKQCAIALGVCIGLSWASAWALLQNDLKGIELNSTAIETRVTLKADSPIPFRIVSKSAEKIVIDLNSVDPTQSIPTDFAAADNIEQVILKPLTNNKLRMVIRGERLGVPIIESMKGGRIAAKNTDPLFEQESFSPKAASKIKAPDENGHSMLAMEAPQKQAEAPKPIFSEEQPAVGEGKQQSPSADSAETSMDLAALEAEEARLLQEAEALDLETPEAEAAPDREAIVDRHNVEDTATVDEEGFSWQDALASTLGAIQSVANKALAKTDKGLLFQLIAFAGFFILSVAVLRKVLTRKEVWYDDEPAENAYDYPQEKGPGLLAGLFGGNRNKRPFSQARPSRGTSPRPARTGERPVGLRGLTQDAVPPMPMSRETLVNRSQAVNQYARNAAPAYPPQPRPSREIDRELKRSIHTRQAIEKTHSRKPFTNTGSAASRPMPPRQPQMGSHQASGAFAPPRAAAPTRRPAANMPPQRQQQAPAAGRPQAPAQSRPIPPAYQQSQPPRRQPQPQQQPGFPANNNEVLDFLRNVAELMEKDGNSHQAQNIKRGMQPRPGR